MKSDAWFLVHHLFLRAKISEIFDIFKYSLKLLLKKSAMKTSMFILTEAQKLTYSEMLSIRGGRKLWGPGDTVADDIDMPDITAAPDPGDTVADDIDMPDITLSPVRHNRVAGRALRVQLFSWDFKHFICFEQSNDHYHKYLITSKPNPLSYEINESH